MPTITPFLWFDDNAEEAVRFYTSIFPDSKVAHLNKVTGSFTLQGQEFMVLNAGPRYKFNEAVSFFVSCEDQKEVDYYWSRLTADGGSESQCGWLKDKFGLSWQVIPKALSRLLGDTDRERSNRAMQAMLKMKKIDVAELERAAGVKD